MTADLFLFMGQSNMGGFGDSSLAPAVPESAGYEYRAVSSPGRLFPVTEPFGCNENREGGIDDRHRDGSAEKTGSMVSSFILAYHEMTGVPVIALSASRDNSSINDWLPGTAFFSDAISRLESAVSFASGESILLRYRFVLWCQGETDGERGMDEREYGEKLRMLIDSLDMIDGFFIVATGSHNAPGMEHQYDGIRRAQLALCNGRDVFLASDLLRTMIARGMMKDEWHPTQEGYNQTGRDAGLNAGAIVRKGNLPSRV